MKWRVIGADRATGEDRVIEVDAGTKTQAQMRAKEFNMYVAEVDAVPVPVIPYISGRHQTTKKKRITLKQVAIYLALLAIVSWATYATVRHFEYRALLKEYYSVAPFGIADLEADLDSYLDTRVYLARFQGVVEPDISQSYYDRIARAREIRREISLMGYSPPAD